MTDIPSPQPEHQHTPGPWEVWAGGSHGGLKVRAGSMLVATVARANLDFAFNARLIAAAPDLLAALRNLVDPKRDLFADILAAQDAIAKATGAQA
jgi:hypothetical protein